MSFSDAMRVSFEALFANKLRAALTMFGMIIGVGAVIALMAVGQGSQKAVMDRTAGLGSNLLFVRPGSQSSGGVAQGAGSARTLSVDDATQIAQGVTGVVAAAPEVQLGAQV